MRGVVGYQNGVSPVFKIGGDTTYVVPTITPQTVPIPPLYTGEIPEWVSFTGPTEGCQFKLGDASVDVTTGGIECSFLRNYIPIACRGHSHVDVWDPTAIGSKEMHITPIASIASLNAHRGFRFGSDAVQATGVVDSATTEVAIPTDATGNRARVVYIWGEAQIHVKPGFTGDEVHADKNGLRMKSAYPALIDCAGYTHLLMSASNATPHVTNVVPLENR